MYLVQTVSSRPRPWSSYTNISTSKELRNPIRMNSAEEISKYHDHNSHYCSPVLARRSAGTSYDFPEKSPKKDKKWSLGSLFRRKKKPGSESSSEDENDNKGFLQRRKKRTDKRKRTNKTIGFDHVVIPRQSRRPTTLFNGYKNHSPESPKKDRGMSNTKNFIPASDFTTRFVPLKDSQENINRSNNSLGSPSLSSVGRRRREVLKARVEARIRDTSKGGGSSEEDSQRSFRSDDSMSKVRDGSLNRKSRAARTQRYLRRLSKDEELPDQLRMCKSDMEHDYYRNVKLADERIHNIKSSAVKPKLSYANSAPSSSRPNLSGLSTIPPSHSSHGKYRTINSTGGGLCKQTSSFKHENKHLSTDLNNQRSLSCDADIHNTVPSPVNEAEIVHVQFQLGKPFNKLSNPAVTSEKKQPPPPPPRDPRRVLNIQSYDGRPISYSFENGYSSRNNSDQHLNKPQLIPEVNKNVNNLNPKCRSTSEDHISWERSQRSPLIPRPSSATPEANTLQKSASNGYRYLADKNPRSRKPICIQSYNNQEDNNKSQKPFDFWKRKDEAITRSNSKISSNNNSPLMFTAQTHVRTNIFLPNCVTTEINSEETIKRESSPFRPITPAKSPEKIIEANGTSLDETDSIQRKSSNLEDALDELEAIYKSLHLGDEDLLERAEQREAAAAQKRRDAILESFPNSVSSRGALSDSGFGYDLNFDSSRKKRYLKRTEPDRKNDDMAFRKLNKDRYNTISDPQSVVSKVSYLLNSPIFSKTVDDESVVQQPKSNAKEPDVTFDDVVYRNVKHTNNALKVADPQPPFGIPIGPVLPAANSDYLHAMPENTRRYTFKSKKIPDVVKDDLAFRNLRKDPNKEPALPKTNFSIEDSINNNNNKVGESLKKKRAVRSLSANLFNLMQKEWRENSIPREDSNDKQNIGDVADSLEIARQILKEKEEKINLTRKAFLSDGELKYRKFERSCSSEQRLNFLNQMKSSNSFDNEPVYHHKLQVNIPVTDFERLDAKPPTPDRSRRSSRPSTKESTPVPNGSSEEPQNKKQLQQSIDKLLSTLAVEAREASERITNELKVYDEENQLKKSLENNDHQKERLGLVSEKLKELEENTISASLNLQLPKVDTTLEHAKLCEKLLECMVDSTDLLVNTRLESEPSEEVAGINPEPLLPETVANIVLIPDEDEKSKFDVNPASTELFSESDHDYVNVQSAEEFETEITKNSTEDVTSNHFLDSSTEIDDEEKELLRIDDDTVSADICVSPLEKHKAVIIAAFDELRTSDGKNMCGKNDQTNKDGGEECVSVQYIALPTQGCAFTNDAYVNVSDVDWKEPEGQLSVLEFDLGAKGNFSDDESGGNLDIWINDDDALDSLKSPKLVQNLNRNMINNTEGNLERDFEVEDNAESCMDVQEHFKIISSYDNNNLEINIDFPFGKDDECLRDCNDTFLSSRGIDCEQNSSLEEEECENYSKCYETNEKFNANSSVRKQFNKEHKNLADTNFGSSSSNSQHISNLNQNFDLNSSGDSKSLEENTLKSIKVGECSSSDVPKMGDFKFCDTNANSCTKSKLNAHESSRHTLVESEPSRTWYEDPAVIALACSCGIACTSQLPSFDIIAVLGLLFAIISLFIALLART